MSPLIEQNKDLTPFTTFGTPAKARYFARYNSPAALKKILATDIFRTSEWFHIGGGSNLLFTGDYNGLILKSDILGRVSYTKNDDIIYAIAGAGENWSDFVDWCVDQDLAGLENLAGIPGEVGASPIQNVGAYGVEAGELIHAVEVMDVSTGQIFTLKGSECGFAYRESYFKHKWKGKLIVLRVCFRLRKSIEALNLDYGPLRQLKATLGHHPSITEVRDEIISIRNQKLPDPQKLGSAGSFFRNPIVDSYYFNEIIKPLAPDIVAYPSEDGSQIKLSAGWLIEHADMKGATEGGAEVYPKQCLVIVNRGNATSQDVMKLAHEVQREVKRHFTVQLNPEVNYVSTALEIEILGSGTSKGVPEIGCLCPVCQSDDKDDKRLRSSVWIKHNGLSIVIDPSPDFRQQALSAGIDKIDAIIVTHSHYDHVGGIDDVRPFCITSDIPIYAQQDVIHDLKKRLDYCFRDSLYPGVPRLSLHEILPMQPFSIDGLEILPLCVMHGKLPILGFRIGRFAYITDASSLPDSTMQELHGLHTLVINALRHRPHFAHFSLEQAVEIAKELNPEKTFFTHMCHEIGLHHKENLKLPEDMALAHDGLKLQIP